MKHKQTNSFIKRKGERKALTITGVIFLLIALSIFLLPVASAEEYGYNYLEKGKNLNPLINYSKVWVNSSNFTDKWVTNEGVLNNVADIQHNWLSNLLWSLAGHIMDTDLDMKANNINNVTDITVVGTICLDADCEHKIKRNSDAFPFNGIAEDAVWFDHTEIHTSGDIAFLFSHANKTQAFWQVGKNNSYSGIAGNSAGIIPNYWGNDNFTENGIINMSKLSNYLTICDTFGDSLFNSPGDICRFTADTSTRGMPLLFTGDLEVWLQTVLHGGVTSFGDAEFIMDGNNFDIINGSLHPRTPRVEEVGFFEGDNVTELNANFNGGGLSPFVVLTSGGAPDWIVLSSVFCHSDLCSRALGGTGSPLRLMEANFSTLDLNTTYLSFWITSNLGGSDVLDVNVNNNDGSGDVTVFTTSATLIDQQQNIVLPTSMNNHPIVSLTFELTANNPTQDVAYIDEVTVVGLANASTAVNLTRLDTTIFLGDGTFKIYWNGSDNTLSIPGNITAENVNNLTTLAITLGGETITNWDNVSSFDDNVFLKDGSRTMTGNADLGGFNLDNVNNLTTNGLFTIDKAGGSMPNFIMKGIGEQTFRFYNSAPTGSTRVSWKMASRLDTDWTFIWYTDSSQNGAEDLTLLGRVDKAFTIQPNGDMSFSNNELVTTGDMTANHFIGNGSQLTGLPTAGNSSWNQTYANTLYVNITGDTMTGDLTVIADVNITGNLTVTGIRNQLMPNFWTCQLTSTSDPVMTSNLTKSIEDGDC